MRLFDLPYLVQAEILKQMEYSELFLFSLCSKRLTKLLRFTTARQIEKIHYEIYGQRVNVIAINRKGVRINIVFIYPLVKRPRDTVDINVSGMSTFYSMENIVFGIPRIKHPVVYSESFNREQILKAVSMQIDALFGSFKQGRLIVDEKYDQLPTFLRNTSTELFFREEPTARMLEEYFSKAPQQDFIETWIKTMNGQLPSDSKFYRANVLNVRCGNLLAPEILRNFKGQKAFLNMSECSDDDIIQCVNRWKSREAWQKLEVLEVHFKWWPGLIDIEKMKLDIDCKELSTLVNLPAVYVPERSKELDWRESSFTFPTYIVRDDGVVAYVLITSTRFIFYLKKRSSIE